MKLLLFTKDEGDGEYVVIADDDESGELVKDPEEGYSIYQEVDLGDVGLVAFPTNTTLLPKRMFQPMP